MNNFFVAQDDYSFISKFLNPLTEPSENLKRRWSEEENATSPTTTVTKHLRRSVTTEMSAATSTTQSESPPKQNPPKLPAEPSEWSIEDVIQHITSTDPALAIHGDLFRKHVSITVLTFCAQFDTRYELFIISGNRWKSSASPQLRYDDEIHGLETRTSTQDMQSRQQGKRTTSHVMMKLKFYSL